MFTVLYLIFVIIASIEGRRAIFMSKGRLEKIDRDWATLMPLSAYVMIMASGISEYFIITRQVNFIASFTGSILFMAGRSLRNHSIQALGNYWSIHVKADSVGQIVHAGPYKYISHPYYISSLVSLAGVLLISNSYYSILLIFLFQLPLYIMRIYMEERELAGKFGKEYILYKKGVWI